MLYGAFLVDVYVSMMLCGAPDCHVAVRSTWLCLCFDDVVRSILISMLLFGARGSVFVTTQFHGHCSFFWSIFLLDRHLFFPLPSVQSCGE
ncbi:unnamed protein product [Linum trigynum]|uniref:Secreted protein n=1 Tax=Linum trigynum TaxID=586398 RepID=A0AAV2G8J0_9ROSI